jgi:hypothetical protein
MEKKVAGFIVAPIWHDFMERSLKTIPTEPFGTPEYEKPTKPVLVGEWRGSRTYVIDSASGNLATDATPPEFRETKVVPEIHTILHWVDKNDPTGTIPTNPTHDGQYNNWETGVRAWAQSAGVLNNENITMPTETDTVHTEENKPRVEILKPTVNESFSIDDTLTITTNITSTYPLSQVDYFLNGDYIGANKTLFKAFSFTIPPETPPNSNVTVKAYDKMGNIGETQVSISITE